MTSIHSFRDLLVWQKAHSMIKQVYFETKKFPKDELYGLTSQIRRSAVSVGSNIVEGFARKGSKEELAFYNIANASLEELKFQLLLSFDFEYIPNSNYQIIHELCDETGRLLRGWVSARKINTSQFKS